MENKTTTPQRLRKQVKKYEQGSENDDEIDEETFKCECGRICLTEQQLKSHMRLCDELSDEGISYTEITEDICEDWRSMAKDGLTTPEIQEEYNYSGNAIRTHLRGDCSHGDSGLEYDSSKRKWVQSGEKGVKECECGRVYLTQEQLNSHKPFCEAINDGSVNPQEVCEDRCKLWRKQLPTYQTVTEMADDIKYSKSTLRDHLSNRCNHDSYEIYWEFTGSYWEARQK